MKWAEKWKNAAHFEILECCLAKMHSVGVWVQYLFLITINGAVFAWREGQTVGAYWAKLNLRRRVCNQWRGINAHQRGEEPGCFYLRSRRLPEQKDHMTPKARERDRDRETERQSEQREKEKDKYYHRGEIPRSLFKIPSNCLQKTQHASATHTCTHPCTRRHITCVARA